MLQGDIIGRGWPDVVNTALLVLGPIAVVLAQWLTSRNTKNVVKRQLDAQTDDVKAELKNQAAAVKEELQVRSNVVDDKLGALHNDVSSNLDGARREIIDLNHKLMLVQRPPDARTRETD